MLPKHLYRACTTCGTLRAPTRFAPGSLTCCYCRDRAPRLALILARRDAHARLIASLPSPYLVRCTRCGHDQAVTHYPWVTGQAVRGTICKSCHGHKAGRPRSQEPKPVKPRPYGPTARRTAARRQARRLLRA